jgi:hypothetical protein
MLVMKKSILLTLIHNNNEGRNIITRAGIVRFKNYLTPFYTINLNEVAYQAEIAPLRKKMTLFRRVIYLYLECQWSIYRKARLSILRHLSLGPLKIGWFLLPQNKVIFQQLMRSSAIEIALSDKHVRAWDLFLESGLEYLVVFEDDAVFKDNMFEVFESHLRHIENRVGDDGLYIDIGAGLPMEFLRVDKLTISNQLGIVKFKKPVTNTTCAYLINKTLAEKLKKLVMLNPWLRLIGSDWMLNKLFICGFLFYNLEEYLF